MKTIFILAVLISSLLQARERVEFNNVNLRGSGCREGTTSTVVSPDGKTLSILFDSFTAAVPQYGDDNDNDIKALGNLSKVSRKNDPLFNKKNCSIVLKIKIPEGEKVSNIALRYEFRGFTALDRGVQSQFRSALISKSGMRTNRLRNVSILEEKSWNGEEDTDFYLSSTKNIPVNSACAKRGDKNLNLRLANTLMAKVNPRSRLADVEGEITLDSADFNAQMKVIVKTQKCGGLPPVKVCARGQVFVKRLNKCMHVKPVKPIKPIVCPRDGIYHERLKRCIPKPIPRPCGRHGRRCAER